MFNVIYRMANNPVDSTPNRNDYDDQEHLDVLYISLFLIAPMDRTKGSWCIARVTGHHDLVIGRRRKCVSNAVHSLLRRSIFLEMQYVLTLMLLIFCCLSIAHTEMLLRHALLWKKVRPASEII